MKRKIYIIILLLIVGVVLKLFYDGHTYKAEINENEKITVAKFAYYKKFPKTEEYYFKYYANGIEYINHYGKTNPDFINNVGKFYQLRHSSKDPNKIIVNFNKEITDTTAIMEAGFRK